MLLDGQIKGGHMNSDTQWYLESVSLQVVGQVVFASATEVKLVAGRHHKLISKWQV